MKWLSSKAVLFLSWVSIYIFFIFGCEKQEPEKQQKKEGRALSQLVFNEEYWEGTSTEFKESFFTNDEFLFCRKDNEKPYSGIIKIRSRTGLVSASSSYALGLRDGDFFEWHDNGRLKSKSQYKQGMRHGYFYVWTDNGFVYSRKYYPRRLRRL